MRVVFYRVYNKFLVQLLHINITSVLKGYLDIFDNISIKMHNYLIYCNKLTNSTRQTETTKDKPGTRQLRNKDKV
jgi:hypothetical protein